MVQTETVRYASLPAFMAANRSAGYHFFDPGTIRFFKSRVIGPLVAGRYFITSEQYDREPRRYTVREATSACTVDSVGHFQQYPTLALARRAIRTLAAAEVRM